LRDLVAEFDSQTEMPEEPVVQSGTVIERVGAAGALQPRVPGRRERVESAGPEVIVAVCGQDCERGAEVAVRRQYGSLGPGPEAPKKYELAAGADLEGSRAAVRYGSGRDVQVGVRMLASRGAG
jgi:hypothetical protein